MQIEVLQEHLVVAVNQLQKIIPTKASLPILSTILLSAQDHTIQLAATDLFIGMQIDLPGKVIKPGLVAIPGKIFREYITTLSPGKITLVIEGESLTIKAGANNTVIQCLPPSEFPEFPTIESEGFSLSGLDLMKIDARVHFAASLDLTRPVLTSLLFEFSQDGLLVVATDSFRLATLKLAGVKALDNTSLLLPARAVGEVSKIVGQLKIDEVQWQVALEQKQILSVIGSTKVFVRLIEGEYPPYAKIIPPEFKLTTVVEAVELEEHLKRAMIFSRESSNIVKLSFSQQQLKISATSSLYGSHEGIIDLEKTVDEDIALAFNARYLLDFLSALRPEKLEICLNEPLTPALFRPLNVADYRYIVMPFRIND